MKKKIISVILLSTLCVIQNLALSQGTSDQKSSESVFQLTLPSVDISPFLPQQKAEGNAAEFYVKALKVLEHYPGKDRLLKDVTEEPDKLLQDRQVQQMLSHICEGARIKSCDFTISFPAPSSIYDYDKRPGFPFFQAMCKALAYEVDSFLSAGNDPAAIEPAKVIVAVGNHLRQSAYHPIEEMGGISLEQLGIRNLQKIYQKMNDTARADLYQGPVDKLQQISTTIIKKMRAKGTGPGVPTMDTLKAMLKDKAPCMRIDALFIIGNAFHPDREKRAGQAYIDYYRQLRTKKQDLKSAITPLLNDPDQRVRDVAEKVAERLK